MTEQAQNKVKSSLLKRKSGVGIRIGVKTSGCSGLAYVLEFIDQDIDALQEERIIFSDFVLKVATKDMVYLKGLEIDYVRNGLNEGFQFNNPNERDRCGCGSSFRV